MGEWLKNLCIAIVVGMILVWTANLFDSSYLNGFFNQNLIMLLIALLAINITTMSIIVTKLTEVKEEGKNFPLTITEMKISVLEQVLLIIFGLISQILNTSKLVVA